MSEPITAGQFHEAEGVEDWRVVVEGAGAYFRTPPEQAEACVCTMHSSGFD